jgi:hypothetical protein
VAVAEFNILRHLLGYTEKKAIKISGSILSWDRDLKQRLATCYPFECNELALIGWLRKNTLGQSLAFYTAFTLSKLKIPLEELTACGEVRQTRMPPAGIL